MFLKESHLITIGIVICVIDVVMVAATRCYTCDNFRTSEDCMNITQCNGREVCYARADGLSTGEVRYTVGCTIEKVAVTVSSTFCSDTCTENLCNLDKCHVPVSPFGQPVRPPRCYSCEYIQNPDDCNNLVQCKVNEVCYVRKINVYGNTRFNTGCMELQHCSTHSSPGTGNIDPSSIIGRRSTQTNTSCSLCCTTDHCNADACSSTQHLAGTVHQLKLLGENDTCEDHNPEACSTFGILNENACSLLPNVDKMCPKTCALCGHFGWSQWSNWSVCSQTCDVGIRQRSRTCLYQTEKSQPHVCEGNSTETMRCDEGNCAVEGHWSEWEPWGQCPITCGNGTITRSRQCQSTSFHQGGIYCAGNRLDYSECNAGMCPDSELSCPDGWIPHHPSCYYFGNTPVTVEANKIYCRLHRATMIQIESTAENNFIERQLSAFKGDLGFWLGMTDAAVEGRWTWMDTNQPVNFTNWNTDEGQNQHDIEDCAILYAPYNFTMADVDCSASFNAMCERRA